MIIVYQFYKNENKIHFISISKNTQSMINLLNFFIALFPILAIYYSKILINNEYFNRN